MDQITRNNNNSIHGEILNCFLENDAELFKNRCSLMNGKIKKRFTKNKTINKHYSFIFPNYDNKYLGYVIKNISISNFNKVNKIEILIDNEICDTFYKEINLSLKFINDIDNTIIPLYINKLGFPILNNKIIKLNIYTDEIVNVDIKYELYKCKGKYVDTPWGTKIYGKSDENYINENIIFKNNLTEILVNNLESIDIEKDIYYYFILVGDIQPNNKLEISLCNDKERLYMPKIKSIGNNHIYGFASDYYDYLNAIDLHNYNDIKLFLPEFDKLRIYAISSKFMEFI